MNGVRRRIVLVTTSSEFQNGGALVEAALAGLADEDCGAAATMPAGSMPSEVRRNARVERFVPHMPLLGIAEVAVTHGGMGAMQKALSAGVPVVAVPWGRDQAEVGRRAETAGVGVLLPERKLRPSTLGAAVIKARTLVPAASSFADAMRRAGGALLAAERLEKLAAPDMPAGNALERTPSSSRIQLAGAIRSRPDIDPAAASENAS
jgi:UDP:flavonoid glycosyltransferase YjiC (YdhE family)